MGEIQGQALPEDFAPAFRIRPDVATDEETAMADVVASQVSVRELKTHLSEWLARAQAGEVVEVTSHRKPIARITKWNLRMAK